MTRNWILCGTPAAFLAGLLMVHCSSSTTSSSSSSSSTTSGSSSTKSSSGASSAKSTSGGSSGGSTSGASASKSSSAASSSEGAKDAGGDVFNAHPGDLDGGCQPTEGGLPCTPGTISCGDASCGVPAEICCDNPGTSELCQAPTAACAGTEVACDEAADCPTGQICCIHSTGTTAATAKVSCQPAPTCPSPAGSIAAQQICRSNKECPSGECSLWSCVGNTIQACANPVPGAPSLCTKM